MGLAAMRPSGDGRHDYRSRGSAAIIAVAVHVGLLLLFMVSFTRTIVPEPAAIEPMLARLLDQPRGQHQDSDRPALAPRFIKPTLRLADTPPNPPIEIPVEIPPAPQPSEVAASAPPGHKDVEGEGSPHGSTQGNDAGAGRAILHQVAPIYSAASVRAHEQGTVTLKVLVDAQGAPAQIRLDASSGFPRLDGSAVDAVQHYRFTPSPSQTQPQGYWTTVKVEFDLLQMPVPMSVVQFDSAIAEQVAAAKRTNPATRLDILKITPRISRLADRLLDLLSHGNEGAAGPQHPGTSPTPLQLLARQGKLRSVSFVGFAAEGFDCGAATAPKDPHDARCEIFEVQQDSGTSYWLARMGDSGTRFENVAVAAAGAQLRAANLPLR